MAGEQFYSTNTNGLRQSSDYLERPRLNKLLEGALDYPLVLVCAGSGYGKTHAVSSFLQHFEATATWLQLSERDNIATRFWESYSNTVALSLPATGARLKKIGFPDTEEAFAQYMAAMGEVAALPGKHIRVFDDVHLLHDPAVLHFFEQAASMIPHNVTLLLISRTIPEINLIGMMMRELVFTIDEDTLCFTEEEVAEYFSQLKLTVSRQDIRHIRDDTQGWAFAINLIGRSLGKEQRYERSALEATKKNIFRLIDAEVSLTASPALWRFLLRLSLIDHLAASLIKSLAKDEALITQMESLNAYIRYDYRLDTYLIHHLFLDFLRSNQGILTDAEKHETYQEAGLWCEANGYYMDALSYFEKSGDYGAITRIIATFNIQMPPDVARYALEIFDSAPEEVKAGNPIFPGLHIRLKTNLGQFTEETVALARSYAQDLEARPDSVEKFRALSILYSNWGILRMFMCTYDDAYDFDVSFKKMGENFAKSPFKTIGAFNIIPIIAWASPVGTDRAGAIEECIGAITRSIPDVSTMGDGCFVGLDDLAWGELRFYQGSFDEAEQFLKRAVEKAFACDQYVTCNRAMVYLMQIALFRGDFASASRQLQAMEGLLSERDHGVRYMMYDIACGFYYLALGQPEQVPEWLKGDYSPYTHPAFLESYANRAKVLYRYQTQQYSELLAFAENALGRQMVLFGRIGLKVLEALSLYQQKQRAAAVNALTEAYFLAESNQIVVPFIQYVKDMRTLSSAALKESGCPIPKEWLENINRKASALAKRKAHVVSEYRAANRLTTGIDLSKREVKILKDLSHGLSRSEIAVSQNLSVNTVKMVVASIYEKLQVENLPDAIRVAVSSKII